MRTRPATRLLAVLPFENLGDSADAYFADGVANDLRTKLSQVAGLAVIARGSSNEYRQTRKPRSRSPASWASIICSLPPSSGKRCAGGTSRVRVTPELVDVRPGHAPRTRWGQQFDAAMTGVFQVQADIAGKVVQALNVALGDSTKRRAGGEADTEPARVRCVPPGRSRLAGDDCVRPAESPSGDSRVRTGGGARLRLRQGLGTARPSQSLPLRPKHADTAGGRGRPPGGRAGALHWPPIDPKAITLLALYYSVLAENPRASESGQHALALAPGTPSCLVPWVWMRSVSGGGTRRASTSSRLPGSIPARRGPPDGSGTVLLLDSPLPGGQAGLSTARSSSRLQT